MTRQRLWQMKKKAAGLCVLCGAKRNLYASTCDDCAAKRRVSRGCNPWRPGGRGVPPKAVQA